MSQTIELTNIGPVDHVSIPIPEDGGIVVLRGRNGVGKTKTLEAVETAVSGRGRLSVKDSHLRGSVDAFGVTLKVGRAVRRKGELEVQTLDGRFNVADLVDPGLKSPEAADAKRIKAHIQVAGVEADPSLFHAIVGGKDRFCELVGSAATETDDLVVMADRIKRDLDAAARKSEDQAKKSHAADEAARSLADDTDLTAEDNSQKLQGALENAVTDRAGLESRAESAERQHRQAIDAGLKLTQLAESYDGPTATEADTAALAAAREAAAAKVLVDRVESQLREVKQDRQDAIAAAEKAEAASKAANQHEELLAECKQITQSALPERITRADLDDAEEAVVQSRQAVELGAVVRRAKQQVEAAQFHATEAKRHVTQAEQLRDAAKSTDEVLSSVVAQAGSPLRVEAGRLVIDTDRGVTYFGDLSEGERWKIALTVAIEAVGEGGLLIVPQSAFEGLDAEVRSVIADHVRGRGVVVLTAEADHDEPVGDLRAEEYGVQAGCA